MAGKIIVDTLDTDNSFITLNVQQATVATMNANGIFSRTGTKMIGTDGSIGNSSISGATVSGNLNFDATGTSGIRLPAANTLSFHTTGTEDMRITSTGIIAVGTTTPNTTNKLEVSGNVGVSWAGNTFIGMKFNDGNAYKMGMQLNNVTREAAFWTQSADSDDRMTFYTGSTPTERMRIDSAGNLGVGATNPQNKLDVQGNVNGPIVRVLNNRDTAGSIGIKVTLGVSGGAGTTDSAHFHGNTNAVGNWYLFGNGTTSYSSDQRLKKNIESARDGYLEDLARLRVVKYNWNASLQDAPKELGLIAQEVEQIFPGLVQDDANPVTEGDETVYKQLKQSVLPFMLLKAIQELKALNDTQAATITALTARIVAIESK